MFGAMQEKPLLISQLIEFASKNHSDTEIVSRRIEGDLHRYTYREAAARSRQVANALDRLNLSVGARVGTLAWNGYRHFELYFGASGSARVLHTINPRLTPEQIAWIIKDAEDEVVCFDLTFMAIIEAVAMQCPRVRQWVLMADADRIPATTSIHGLIDYESWIAAESAEYAWPEFDERTAAALCYTSGTTGNPKGVLYSHRSTVLHAYAGATPDAMNLSSRDCVLPVVPMFHVNAWGIPYVASMMGVKLVFPGAALDGKSLYDLIEVEGVTMAAGVPTVWLGLLNHVDSVQGKFLAMRRTVIGGSACPRAMIERFRALGVTVLHAWGMTEMSPLGTLCTLKRKHLAESEDTQLALMEKQGRAIFGVEMKIVDDGGRELPRDGKSTGDLLVRGPWILSQYFKGVGGNPLVGDDWFPTGDVASIDPDGFMQITDRSKDVIKSGGEWISSIDIENIAMGHPAVAMAACIAVPHPKWDERPLLVVVRKPGAEVSAEALLMFYRDKVAKWQVPDDVVFVDTIPLGATGKMQKIKLRETFRNYLVGR